MGFLDLVKAEYMLVYGDMFRRRSAFVTFIIYPYIFTAFTLFVGYAAGSPQAFINKVGVDPVVYMVTASYILMSLFAAIDDVLWRPLYDMHIGTLPYIIATPVNKLMLYTAIPIPRITAVLILGFTSVLPIYIVYYGLQGLITAFIIMVVLTLGCLTMIFFSIAIAASVHRVSESWRILNLVRPIMMILMGIYYPRMFMPLAGYIVSSLIPSSHVVEVIQRILMGIGSNIHIPIVLAIAVSFIYMPLGRSALTKWEKAKVREGVKTL